MLEINVALSDPGSDCNEDRVGYARDTMWVIDGATGTGDKLTDTPSDAAWLAETANAAFAALVNAEPDLGLQELVRAAIAHCRDEFETVQLGPLQPDATLPSAAFMLARARHGELEIVSLGDCGTLIERDGEVVVIGTGQSAKENETIAHTNAILAETPGLEGRELIEKIAPKLKTDRKRMNREGGYWIFSLAPEAADHLRRTEVPIEDGQEIAMASDGFLRLIDVFDCETPASLLSASGQGAANALLTELRGLERAADSRERFPRIKLMDDASFLHATHRAD
ncbi:hypothetical protein GRI58_10510 [Porphyrobacter algicida]|uniref:PPM-type phosphatase domain-containing protein n=1 Tax=Qipengyuania algicida TaxID=1836209 RepID=A0A845AK27_9SPHN|nr:protein phosphatase 2C domain-containing protein [Qipengyuania algicida]MXP29251.1 hypothetical protein [Qipengyuania algicida]